MERRRPEILLLLLALVSLGHTHYSTPSPYDRTSRDSGQFLAAMRLCEPASPPIDSVAVLAEQRHLHALIDAAKAKAKADLSRAGVMLMNATDAISRAKAAAAVKEASDESNVAAAAEVGAARMREQQKELALQQANPYIRPPPLESAPNDLLPVVVPIHAPKVSPVDISRTRRRTAWPELLSTSACASSLVPLLVPPRRLGDELERCHHARLQRRCGAQGVGPASRPNAAGGRAALVARCPLHGRGTPLQQQDVCASHSGDKEGAGAAPRIFADGLKVRGLLGLKATRLSHGVLPSPRLHTPPSPPNRHAVAMDAESEVMSQTIRWEPFVAQWERDRVVLGAGNYKSVGCRFCMMYVHQP